MADTEKAPGLLANILAVAGFIILIVIIVWGAYHLLRLTGTGVSSFFSRFGQSDEITVTVPSAPIQSGATFPVSWKYETEDEGNFAFLYQCKAGFRLDVATQNGATQAIPCGNAFTVGANTSLTLKATLSGTSTLEVPLTVVFMPTATSTDERPQGGANITVLSRITQTAQPSVPSTPSTPSTSVPSTPVTGGTPDLAVSIMAVGVIDQWGNFVARAPMNPGETAAVKFDIKNSGTASTGSWYFTANLPMQGGYLYSSPMQKSLAPGAHIENILRFRPVTGGGNISVSVDTTHAVTESNEGNNTSAVWMNAGMYQNQYYSPVVF